MDNKNIEKKIVSIAALLVNVQTVEGVAETMNRIAVLIDGYNDSTATYFTGLYEHIDRNDRAFQPLDSYDEWKVKKLGARIIISPTPENAVNLLVKLHHLLKWMEGEKAMITMTDKLYEIVNNMD